MKSQVLHTVWCNISGDAVGEIWNWSFLGMKRLTSSTHTNLTILDRAGLARCPDVTEMIFPAKQNTIHLSSMVVTLLIRGCFITKLLLHQTSKACDLPEGSNWPASYWQQGWGGKNKWYFLSSIHHIWANNTDWASSPSLRWDKYAAGNSKLKCPTLWSTN